MTDPFDEFHARGRTAVLAGEAIYDRPPSNDSPRWGVSVILRPDPVAAARLAELSHELAALVGAAHWPTGRLGTSHLTVRGLEPYRDRVPADDPLLGRYAAAVSRAAAAAVSHAAERSVPSTGALTFAMTGLVLVPGGVVVVADPVDDAPTRLRASLAAELGADGAFEDPTYRRDRWWSTLLHFAAPLTDGRELVNWVEARRSLDLGVFRARSLDLVRYAFDGTCTSPVVLASFPV